MKQQSKLQNILFPVLFLVVIALFLLFERIGIDYDTAGHDLEYLPASVVAAKREVGMLKKECVVLTDSTNEYSDVFFNYIAYIFDTISVGYDVVDVSVEGLPDLTLYESAVCVFPDLNILELEVFDLTSWVNSGGRVFFLNPLTPTSSLLVVGNWLGIHEGGKGYSEIHGLSVLTDFMLGSKGAGYTWEEPIFTMDARVSNDSIVHVESDTGTPLLWERTYGKGKFVVNAFPSTQKSTRGLTVAAYSLLHDAFAYPVINTSTIFIDDFPAPVPSGQNEYIAKDYNRSIASFYSNIWWPDMVALSKKYGLKYTGLIIEDYSDMTEPPFIRNNDASSFIFFGSMLLNSGGQIGYHGYNHQPIAFEGFDYKGRLNYNTWKSEEDVKESLEELFGFTENLFPDVNFDVYVPPSNILSEEGRKLLAENYPQLKTFSGIYIKQDYEYEQEFRIDEYGIVNVPRIMSGTILDEYDRWLCFNELNYHYVNSYFIHPDDALDPERGAETGWAAMRARLEDYIDWVYTNAPSIRNLNASDAAKAVQRYDTIRLNRSFDDNAYIIDFDNFFDEAFCIVRIRDGIPGNVTGGILENLSGELYLLSADSSRVQIDIER